MVYITINDTVMCQNSAGIDPNLSAYPLLGEYIDPHKTQVMRTFDIVLLLTLTSSCEHTVESSVIWDALTLTRGHCNHCNDVIMRAMASQITGATSVYSTVCSGADQRKHRISASLAFVRGIHRSPVNSPHKGQQRGKCFYLMNTDKEKVLPYLHIWCRLPL